MATTSTRKPPSGARKPPARRKPAASPSSRARAKRSSATWAPRLPVIEQRHLDIAGLGLVALGVFLAFPLYLEWEAGALGDAVTDGLSVGLGKLRYAVPVVVVAIGSLLVLRPVMPAVRPFRAGTMCLLIALALLFAGDTIGTQDHDALRERGGLAGEVLFAAGAKVVGTVGVHVLMVFLLLAAALLLTGASVATVVRAAADTTRSFTPRRPPAPAPEPAPKPKRAPKRVAPPEPEDDEPVVARATPPPQLDGVERFPDLFPDDVTATHEPPAPAHEPEPEPPSGDPTAKTTVDPPLDEREPVQAELPVLPPAPEDESERDYVLPGPAVLRRSSEAQAKPDTSGQEKTAARLVEALQHFNIEARIVGTVAGPHITRYELRLAPGIKMSKVAQLKDDLAYALAATDIRILAPIPGKTAVGVEVPNANRRIVHLGDVWTEAPAGASPLYVWLGKDVSGKAIGADLAKTPHLLIAGTTGAGKSACVNGLLSSVLLRATPAEAKLVLIDPKQVELNHYEEIPHLLTPVITSPRQAANALQNLVREMEWRYGIMSMARTRSLPELNKHRLANDEQPLPYILCVIDELADLMMVAPADVEDSIIRIAQKARAVGIHLVLATQSPRVDVITGMIKANVPSRIAFAVSSQTDSRVILDQNGAETLLGQGDMLFSPVGSSKLQRIQGAYIDEPQIAKITAFWAQQGEPELREDLLEEVEPEAPAEKSEDGFDPNEDPLLGDAIQLVVEMGTAATSMLQRRLRLGYTRAGRLMDMLERRGIIGPHEGSKPRTVLVTEADLPRVLASLAARGDELAHGEPELPPPPQPPPLADS